MTNLSKGVQAFVNYIESVETLNKALVERNNLLADRLAEIATLAGEVSVHQPKKATNGRYAIKTFYAWDAQAGYVIEFQGERLKRDQFVKEHGGEILGGGDPRVLAHRAAKASRESEEQADADLTRMDEEAAEIDDGNTAESYFNRR